MGAEERAQRTALLQSQLQPIHRGFATYGDRLHDAGAENARLQQKVADALVFSDAEIAAELAAQEGADYDSEDEFWKGLSAEAAAEERGGGGGASSSAGDSARPALA